MKTVTHIQPPRCGAKGLMRWRGDIHDRAVRAHLMWRGLSRLGDRHAERVKRIRDAWAAMIEGSAE